MTFPPPIPSDRFTTAPTAHASSSPRRTASIAALTSGLLVGGLLVGSQFASANNPSIADEPTPPATDAPSADNGTPPGDAELPAETAEWVDADDLFEIDPEIEAQFEQFDACLSEQLGDLGGIVESDDFEIFEDGDVFGGGLEFPAGVFVEAGDDTGFYEFGEGDGTITITKTGDDISVRSDGDVDMQTFDIELGDGEFATELTGLTEEEQAALDAEWAELDAAWEAAESACADLLPEDIFNGGFLDIAVND